MASLNWPHAASKPLAYLDSERAPLVSWARLKEGKFDAHMAERALVMTELSKSLRGSQTALGFIGSNKQKHQLSMKVPPQIPKSEGTKTRCAYFVPPGSVRSGIEAGRMLHPLMSLQVCPHCKTNVATSKWAVDAYGGLGYGNACMHVIM